MKIVKAIKIAVMVSCLIAVSYCVGSESSFKMNTHFKALKKQAPGESAEIPQDKSLYAPKNLTAEDLPDMPIYYQAWIKYFHFQKVESEKSRKPKFFFKNEAFLKQVDTEKERAKEDQYGSFIIPGDSSFFAVVYEDKVNILSSRDTAFLKIADSLSLSLIQNIPDDAHFQGGIRDLGKFSEGYCFEVRTKEPHGFFQMTEKEPFPEKGADRIWYLCSDQEEIKNKLMNLLVKLRLKKQHKVGLWLRKNNPPKKQTIANLMPTPPSATDTITVKNVLDGYWVLLQDWSSCSKKCGGGVQFQHLMCVPPKNGGKPCEGVALRQKPCNQQPCPSVSDAEKVLPQKGKEKINDPIIKMLPISSRPLRYDKCHLKESDTLFTAHKQGVGIDNNNERMPSRVVMNEKTINVFTNEHLETLLATFVIDKTTFKISGRDNKCFILDSDTTKGEFCKLSNDSKINFIEEWNYDFHLFKIQCHTERDTISLNNKEEKELQDELEKKIDSAKLDVIKERTKRIQQKVQEAPINKVDKLQETAMLAMKKELAIDGLLKKEEEEKEEADVRELKLQLENEKKKDECLIKSIKEKEIEDQYNLSKVQQDREMNELKEQVKQQILQKRKQVKMKILQMRKRALRKKKIYQDEIQTLRTQVAGQLNKHNKEGNAGLCFKPTNSEDDKKKVVQYCNANFMDASPNKFKECLNEEDFCYVCCENEFGEMHIKEREKCYDKCEQAPKKSIRAGSWQWTETVE